MLLVDTYNVLHVTGVLPPEIAGPDAVALARLISQSRYRNEETWLVCDGLKRRGVRNEHFEHIRLVYAGAQRESADARIEHILETRRGASVLVVSNDRRLQQAARRARAKWMPSDRFLALLAEDIRTGIVAPERIRLRDSIPLAGGAVHRWMKLFELDEDRIRKLMDSLDVEGITLDPPTEPRETPPPPPAPPPRPRKRRTTRPPEPPPPAEPDPLLDDLLKDAPVDRADLDMQKWLDDPDRQPP